MPKLLDPIKKSLGEFTVSRILPNSSKQMIGPFIFFDHMGPVNFPRGKGIDVRPHPHIGIATVTYLFEGSILHRDSLGYEQEIQPGDINWMTAGKGIVHSERETEKVRNSNHTLHGLQLWVALPDDKQEIDATFHHHPKETLPLFEYDGATIRLMIGEIFGKKSPVKVYSPMFYADVNLPENTNISIPKNGQELGIYIIDGTVSIDNTKYNKFDFIFAGREEEISITANKNAKLILIGGKAFDTERYIWWNFVSNSKNRIEQAKSDWLNGNFDKVPNDNEYIPLPETK
ncbi:MAG: pirin family protein [Pseudomonadota bacterium]